MLFAPLDHHVRFVSLMILIIVFLAHVALVAVAGKGYTIALPRPVADGLGVIVPGLRQMQPAEGAGGMVPEIPSGADAHETVRRDAREAAQGGIRKGPVDAHAPLIVGLEQQVVQVSVDDELLLTLQVEKFAVIIRARVEHAPVAVQLLGCIRLEHIAQLWAHLFAMHIQSIAGGGCIADGK